MKEGWEYAKTWSSSFHSTEHQMDLVRRRRWMRKLIATDHGKLIATDHGKLIATDHGRRPVFYFKSKKQKKVKQLYIVGTGIKVMCLPSHLPHDSCVGPLQAED